MPDSRSNRAAVGDLPFVASSLTMDDENNLAKALEQIVGLLMFDHQIAG